MRLVLLSDTHLRHTDFPLKVPDGDVLIHSGDLTITGKFQEIQEAGEWLAKLPHKLKLVIAGNHDFLFEKDKVTALHALGHGHNGVHYLQDESYDLEGHKVWGSPFTPRFYDWAFQLGESVDRPEPSHWAQIPDDVELLITHGPARWVLDQNSKGNHCGSVWLAEKIQTLHKLKLHVFGHIHEGHGLVKMEERYLAANASICNSLYDPVNKPIVVDLF